MRGKPIAEPRDVRDLPCRVTKLADKQAKKILLDHWPNATNTLWFPFSAGGYWLRAQPVDGQTKVPRISSVGSAAFHTQPDGLWVYLDPATPCADAIAIEVGGSPQNLNDKRSRYMPATTARLVHCDHAWLTYTVSWKAGSQVQRYKATGTWGGTLPPATAMTFPVRFMRVFYFVPDADFGHVARNVVPHGHEFFSRHSSLSTINSKPMREFLRRATLAAHYYPRPK